MTSTKILTCFSLLFLSGSLVSAQSNSMPEMFSSELLQQVLEFLDLASTVWPSLRTIPVDGFLRQPVVCPTANLITAQWSALPNPQRECIPRLVCDGSRTMARYIPLQLHSFVQVNFDQCSKGTLVQAFLKGFRRENCAAKYRTCSYDVFFSWPPALETSTTTATPITTSTTIATPRPASRTMATSRPASRTMATPRPALRTIATPRPALRTIATPRPASTTMATSTAASTTTPTPTTSAAPVMSNQTTNLPLSPSASGSSKPSENPVVSRVRDRLEAMITPSTFANLAPGLRDTLLSSRSSNVAFLASLNSVLASRLHTLRDTAQLI